MLLRQQLLSAQSILVGFLLAISLHRKSLWKDRQAMLKAKYCPRTILPSLR